jgi:hypothetical protein
VLVVGLYKVSEKSKAETITEQLANSKPDPFISPHAIISRGRDSLKSPDSEILSYLMIYYGI